MRQFKSGILGLITLLLVACGAPKAGTQYTLEPNPTLNSVRTSGKTLSVNRITAAEPLHSTKMEYTRANNEIEYYTINHWAVPPSKMLQELFVKAFIESKYYKDVISLPSDLKANERLDLNLLKMRQYFEGKESYVEVEIHARLIDSNTKKTYLSKRYHTKEPAETLDAHGGVKAYNRALARLISEITRDVIRH